MLDDGVNDAWYKSECGQACGFGGEKFKWLVRMVLLLPLCPSFYLRSLSLPLLSFKVRNPKDSSFQQSRLSFAPPATQISPARYRAGARVSFFVSFLLKILKPAARALGQQRCCWVAGHGASIYCAIGSSPLAPERPHE